MPTSTLRLFRCHPRRPLRRGNEANPISGHPIERKAHHTRQTIHRFELFILREGSYDRCLETSGVVSRLIESADLGRRNIPVLEIVSDGGYHLISLERCSPAALFSPHINITRKS